MVTPKGPQDPRVSQGNVGHTDPTATQQKGARRTGRGTSPLAGRVTHANQSDKTGSSIISKGSSAERSSSAFGSVISVGGKERANQPSLLSLGGVLKEIQSLKSKDPELYSILMDPEMRSLAMDAINSPALQDFLKSVKDDPIMKMLTTTIATNPQSLQVVSFSEEKMILGGVDVPDLKSAKCFYHAESKKIFMSKSFSHKEDPKLKEFLKKEKCEAVEINDKNWGLLIQILTTSVGKMKAEQKKDTEGRPVATMERQETQHKEVEREKQTGYKGNVAARVFGAQVAVKTPSTSTAGKREQEKKEMIEKEEKIADERRVKADKQAERQENIKKENINKDQRKKM